MKVNFELYLKTNWMIRTNSILYPKWRANYGKRNFHNYQCGFNQYPRHNLHFSTFTIIHVKV